MALLQLGVCLLFAIAYYSKRLPFGVGVRGLPLALFRWYSRIAMFIGMWMFALQMLWLVSAYYFNPKYVTFVLSLMTSAVGMTFSLASSFSRFLSIAETSGAEGGQVHLPEEALRDQLEGAVETAGEVVATAGEMVDLGTREANKVARAVRAEAERVEAEVEEAATAARDAAEEVRALSAELQGAVKRLELTRQQLVWTHLISIALLLLLAVFIYWGGEMWRTVPSQGGYDTLVMPLFALYSKLKSNAILDDAEGKEGRKSTGTYRPLPSADDAEDVAGPQKPVRAGACPRGRDALSAPHTELQA